MSRRASVVSFPAGGVEEAVGDPAPPFEHDAIGAIVSRRQTMGRKAGALIRSFYAWFALMK